MQVPLLSSSDPRSFESIIFWFTAYYALERGLRRFSRSQNPVFYQHLLLTRKDLPYFGIAMGFLITAISAPTCAYAAFSAHYPWQQPPSPTSASAAAAGPICIVSRSILWVSELNRLGAHNFYLYHHLCALLSLISLTAIHIPLGSVYAIYAGLLSELTGDLLWLQRAHGASSAWLLRCIDNTLYPVARIPGIAFGAYFIARADLSPTQRAVCLVNLLAYAVFVAYSCLSRAVRAGWLSGATEHPAHVRVGSAIFTAYGVCMGLGFAALAGGAAALYPATGSAAEAALVSAAICRVLVSAVLGARLLSIVFEDGWRKLLADPAAAVLRPGFWLHGGIAGAGVGVLLSRGSIQRPVDMVAALGVALPLFEAFSRTGCYSYGCCFGMAAVSERGRRPLLWRVVRMPGVRYCGDGAAVVRVRPEMKGRLLVPAQSIAAVLYALQFAGVVAVLVGGWASVAVAGWGSLAAHAVIRIITERCRDDYRGGVAGGMGTVTGVLAGVQMAVGAAGMASVAGRESFALGGWDQVGAALAEREVLGCAAFAFALGFTVYGFNFRRIGVWVDRK